MHVCMCACMRDSVRLRSTPRSECVLSARCPLCLCVSFLCAGRCTRSHCTGTCQHAFPEGETSARLRSMTGHTLPNLCALQDQDPEPLALPWSAWELRPSQQVMSAPASQTSQAKASRVQTNARSGGGTHTFAGCIPPKLATLTITKETSFLPG